MVVLEGGNRDKIQMLIRKNRNLNYCRLFFRVFNNESNSIKTRVVAGVKYLNLFDLALANSEPIVFSLLNDMFQIDDLMAELSLNELINLFPVSKDYRGEKYGCKDYWSAKSYIDTVDPDQKVDLDLFFVHYWNADIISYMIKKFMVTDKARRFLGQKSLMTSFAEEFNLDTYHKDNGRMVNNRTGESFEIKKPTPRYLRVI